MKAAAYMFMVIWATLVVQPTFSWFGGKSAYGNCSKTDAPKSIVENKAASPGCSKKKKSASTACAKKKCSKPKETDSNNNCNTDGCNPSLGCAAGNFYIHHYTSISLTSWFVQKQNAMVSDDNRILKSLSECWHPPEA